MNILCAHGLTEDEVEAVRVSIGETVIFERLRMYGAAENVLSLASHRSGTVSLTRR